MVFRTIGILLRFFTFFFENPKSRDFLRFFAVLRTFSRTMVCSSFRVNVALKYYKYRSVLAAVIDITLLSRFFGPRCIMHSVDVRKKGKSRRRTLK